MRAEISFVTRRDGVHVLAVRGELDQVTAHRIGAAIADGSLGQPVIIDLSQAPSTPPASIRGLLRDQTTPMALVCAPGNVARLLEAAPTDRHVPICDDLATAISILTVTRQGR